jgi:uridine phosphorylase
MKKRMQPHIMCGIGDVAKYVFLPGDPNRVKRIASFFDKAEKVADYRGYVTYTGETEGVKMSASSTGIGCPTAAIVVEELMKIGANTFIRVGTTGSLQPQLDSGDIVVATGAVRDEGTSKNFIPVEYPAVPNLDLTLALLNAAKDKKRKVHPGIVMSTDVFYGGNEEDLRKYGKAGVLSIEMESSIIFTLSTLRGMRAGAILAVDGNLVKGSMKGEFELGDSTGELNKKVQKAIDDEIQIAIRAALMLEEAEA